MTGTLMSRLKLETREQHEAVERVVPLMKPGLTREELQRYLAQWLSYVRPLEQRLLSFYPELEAAGLEPHKRRRSPLIEQDLGRDVATQANIPAIESAAEAVGSLYVLEGSTLGGKFLAAHLVRTMGYSPRSLTPYGDETGPMWKAFCEGAERFAPQAEEVIRAARATFEGLLHYL